MTYRSDADARDAQNDALRRENTQLFEENEILRRKNAALEGEKLRLQMIAGELLKESPSTLKPLDMQMRAECAIAENANDMRRLLRELADLRRRTRAGVLLLVVAFAFYQILGQLLTR